jgi:hypothetical protein
LSRLVALDPGRSKCGLVLIDCEHNRVLAGAVVPPEAVMAWVKHWHEQDGFDQIIVGDGTGGTQWIRHHLAGSRALLADLASRGWRRLLPRGLAPAPDANSMPSPRWCGWKITSASACTGHPRPSKVQASEPGPYGEGVITTGFKVIVGFHQKAKQGVLNQVHSPKTVPPSTHHDQTPNELPLQSPPALTSPSRHIDLETLAQNPQVSSGCRQEAPLLAQPVPTATH